MSVCFKNARVERMYLNVLCTVQRWNRLRVGVRSKNRAFGAGVKSAWGAIAILAAATTLETCLKPPFTRTIANELLLTIANDCVA